MIERLKEPVPRHLEPAAQIVPDSDAKLFAGLDETKKCITAVATDIAACPGADLSPGDVIVDIVLGTVGVEPDLRAFEHHQQLRLVGMEPGQHAVQRDETGATAEDAIELGAQSRRVALGWLGLVCLETGVEPQIRRRTCDCALR
jgi:hypothetical protein